MGKKKTLKLPSLFKLAPPRSKHHPWQFFLSCAQQNKTLSFRASEYDHDIFFDPFESQVQTIDYTWFTTSPESPSLFQTDSDQNYDGECLDMLVREVKSGRLFFEPGNNNTSSILENNNKAKVVGGAPLNFKESVLLLSMESEDPYSDFRKSMEEVVETHGVKDWKGLEELLSWYLRLNGKNNHGFVVLAFVDLLISLGAAASDSCSQSSYCSAASSFASSPLYPLNQNEVIDHQDEDTGRS
ncbi:transcription repressor OFP13-like [Abrus precatorius]|uniref:Transcription repressor n=1 Tax=Abrus precatorius TaxID=3816 RepID=A0A8B8MHW7_ABRPR|nr:transcription repressor OFP13-like [Abrus precatorius]